MNRFALICLLLATTTAHGNDDASKTAAPASSPPKSFVVEITRLVLQDAKPESAAGLRGARLEAQIRAWRTANQIARDETMSLTSVQDHEAMVQFGRRVSVVTGTSNFGGRSTNQTTWQEVGTIIRVKISPRDDHVAAELVYESSTLEPATDENTHGGVATVQIDTKLNLQLDEPQVITSSQSDQHMALVVNVSQTGSTRITRRGPPTGPRRPATASPRSSGRGPQPFPPGGRPPTSPRGSDPRDRMAEFAKMAFSRADANRNGAIEENEAERLPGGKFSEMDQNEDGKVTLDELTTYFQNRIQRSR